MTPKSYKLQKIREFGVEGILRLIAWTSLVTIILIFIFVGKEALPIFTKPAANKDATLGKMFLAQQYKPDRPPKFIWQPESKVPKYSLIPLLVGTLKATLVAILFAVPISIAAAVYTAEFAKPRLREFIKPAIELLASFPSVVVGFFALIVLASWIQDTFHLIYRLNVLNAGLALSLAIIPIIYTICEDALRAVPKSYKEASLALGASPWQTAWKVVLPAALPGIAAGVVLGFGRAFGETMIVLMAAGNAAIYNWNFTDSVRTLSATIAGELAEVVYGGEHYHVLFFIGALLFVITFLLNLAGGWYIQRLKKKLSGHLA